MPDWTSIADHLDAVGVAIDSGEAPRPVSGGDISAAWRLLTADGELFIKTGPGPTADMFTAEAEGLSEISQTHSVRVPELVAVGETESGAFLALEWLEFEPGNSATERLLGEQLARLHNTSRDDFGWHRDNTIGLTPQKNTPSRNWVEFLGEQRLGYQLRLAANNGHSGELQDRGALLLKRLPIYFDDLNRIEAALLHGDLWGGNCACCDGQPVIFDPAVYYGDREADIAMTRLFGGFGKAFYDAYEEHWPQQDGYHERQCLYQLYHVLNHLNLFGSSYLGRAMSLIDELL